MVSASTFAHMEHTEKSRQTDLAKASVAALRAASEFVSSTALYNRSSSVPRSRILRAEKSKSMKGAESIGEGGE